MIGAGAPITEVQHQLGHSNPSITLGIYSHWFRNAKSGGAAARLAKMALGSLAPGAVAEPMEDGRSEPTAHQSRPAA